MTTGGLKFRLFLVGPCLVPVTLNEMLSALEMPDVSDDGAAIAGWGRCQWAR